MRLSLLAGSMLLCSLAARAGESPDLKLLHDAGHVRLLTDPVPAETGFVPRGAHFRVTFEFARMHIAPKPFEKSPDGLSAPGIWRSPMDWVGEKGAKARLECCCVKRTWGLQELTVAAARVLLVNPSAQPYSTSLSVMVTPEGALPALAFDQHAFLIEGEPVLVAAAPSRGAILADAPFAPRPMAPQQMAHVESAKGECRGEMLYDLTVPPGQTQILGFICPVAPAEGGKLPDLDFYRSLSVDELFDQAAKETGGK
jgi:hypothetical protein